MTSSRPRVLLVEDDHIDIETVRRALKRGDIEIDLVVAHNGIEGLDVLRSADMKGPMTVLLDLNMPRMNGFEFLDILRADPDLKMHQVFVLTTSSDDRDLLAAYERMVAGYIVKPVTFSKFCDAMATLNELWRINEFPRCDARQATGELPAEQQA